MKGLVRVIAGIGLVCASTVIFADELNVGPDAQYKTIGAAMAAAGTDDIIKVAPDTYVENITLKAGVTLVGAETAQTLLKAADNSKAVITASGVTQSRISRFTFISSTTGIQVSNSTVVIAGNVFNLDSTGTGVKLSDTTDTSTISNNTFYLNKLAVSGIGSGTTIKNNIFASNTTAISSPPESNEISYNLFFQNTSDGLTGSNALTGSNPLFVSPGDRDFHLKATSPAIDAGPSTDIDAIDGTRADLGAYGEQHADPKPYPVKNVRIIGPTGTAPSFSVTVEWLPNESYLVDSYNVKFEIKGSTASTLSSTSPQNVRGALSFPLSGSATAGDSVDSPTLTSVEPKSQALTLTWSPIPNATRYKVRYGITEDRLTRIDTQTADAGDVTSYTLSGLQNGKTYMVEVVALKQPTLHVAVNAQGRTATHLSDYSAEVTKALGAEIESSPSTAGFGIPEEVIAFPALPNEGCFIATAAYGSYSAAQVKTLRDFRDRYLLTNTPGRAFVRWYYAHSPAAAQYLNHHPALKPVVRGLLLPFVFITSWINDSMFEMQLAAGALLLGLLVVGLYRRRRTSWA